MPQSLVDILIPTGIMLGIALLLGILIVIISRVFAVEKNETKEKILEALPGANCGGCGFAGCEGYATVHARSLRSLAPRRPSLRRKLPCRVVRVLANRQASVISTLVPAVVMLPRDCSADRTPVHSDVSDSATALPRVLLARSRSKTASAISTARSAMAADSA